MQLVAHRTDQSVTCSQLGGESATNQGREISQSKNGRAAQALFGIEFYRFPMFTLYFIWTKPYVVNATHPCKNLQPSLMSFDPSMKDLCAAQHNASKKIRFVNNVSAAIPGIWHWSSLFMVCLYCCYSAGYLDPGQKCTGILFKAWVQHGMQQGDSFPKGCSFLLPSTCKISCPGSKTSQ